MRDIINILITIREWDSNTRISNIKIDHIDEEIANKKLMILTINFSVFIFNVKKVINIIIGRQIKNEIVTKEASPKYITESIIIMTHMQALKIAVPL
jgi:hypothetical protein